MHPPLYKAHPLCKPEVEALVRCHEEHPYRKFIGHCNDKKHDLDMCFREEKKLRIKLNRRIENPYDEPSRPAAAPAAAPAAPAGSS